jgi:hypothetical protein
VKTLRELSMQSRDLIHAALFAALLCAGTVMAQVQPLVLTDAAPLPAEERESTGAVVLETSLVRAQQDNAFARSSARTGVEAVGRRVIRETLRQKTQTELAQARDQQLLELHERGAGSLTR